jgi:Na+/H+ antiporter NhaD/arsenite permease-like protein
MVAKQWNWDFNYVFFNLGWKSALAVIVNAFLLVTLFSKAFSESCQSLRERVKPSSDDHFEIPSYVLFIHLLFLVGIIITSHYQNAFMGLFLLFLGCVHVSEKYHDRLRLRESLLVALFLGGIIQFGAFQSWWLTPLLKNLNDADLFRGAIALTAVTDNAALTYLGSQVADLSDSSKYALVAGAIAGGGLTVIANAPNAAGVSLLSQKLGSGLNPIRLLLFASVPTAVAILFLH